MASSKTSKPQKTQEEMDAELERRLRAQAISKGVRENSEKETESMVDMVKGGWEKLKGGWNKAFDEPDYAPQTKKLQEQRAREGEPEPHLGLPGMTKEEILEMQRRDRYLKKNPGAEEEYSKEAMDRATEKQRLNKKSSLQRISQPFQKGR